MSYNLHILTHLPESVMNLGPTKNISSYPLENYMGILKDKVRRSSNIAQSLVRIFINDFKYCELLNSISSWPLNERERQNFSDNNSKIQNGDTLIPMKEASNFRLPTEASNLIQRILGVSSVSFCKTISVNGKRFSTVEYGKDNIRCDSIIKSSDGEFVRIEYLFLLETNIYGIGSQIEVHPVNVNFKGFSGSFIFNLPHVFEIKRIKKDLILVKLDKSTKKCIIIPSTKYHYKYRMDYLIEPILFNF